MSSEALIQVENLGKKFCKSLKRSLFYGAQDIAGAINPFAQTQAAEEPKLRKDEFWALKDINFELRRGECLGLIGHNGAGKSTLLKILNGLIKPSTGRIVMRGRVCALIELSAGFNNILTGRENIYNQGVLLGLSKREIDRKLEDIIEFSEIREFIDMPVKNYSSGMRVRLGFAVAIQLEPDVLLLDEVLAVGDAAFRFKCLNAMSTMLNNSAVIFVSHSMAQINRVCNRVALLEKGKTDYLGSDLAEGMRNYFGKIDTPEAKTSSNGDLELLSARVSSDIEPDSPNTEVRAKYRSKLVFDMTFLAHADIEETVIGLTIWNQELYPVGAIKEMSGDQFRTKFKKGETSHCRIVAESVYLNADRYHLSLHVHQGATYYLLVDNLYTIHVEGNKMGRTNYLAPGQMTVNADMHLVNHDK